MNVYNVKTRSGEVLTIEDTRDLATISKALHDDGFLQAVLKVSAYNTGELASISVMERAVDYITLNEPASAAARPNTTATQTSPQGVRAMIAQIAKAVANQDMMPAPRG